MRSFLGFGQATYIGIPQTQPIKLGGISGVVVPLLFQWASYGASTAIPNVNVGVNLETSQCKALGQIRSVYIDNLGSSNPVYVYFPDSGLTLSAKANSEGWYPAYTNKKQFWVIGEGFLDGSIPQTLIIVSNIPMGSSVNTEIDQAVSLFKASPVITRGTSIYNSNFGVPALGDQFFSPVTPLELGITGSTMSLWNTPFASGFLYLTSLTIIPICNNDSAAGFCTIVIESTGIAGLLLTYTFAAPLATGIQNSAILNMPGLQIKLDATQTWRARTTLRADHGKGQIISSFTQQP